MTNPYHYTDNGPINGTDPSGPCPVDDVFNNAGRGSGIVSAPLMAGGCFSGIGTNDDPSGTPEDENGGPPCPGGGDAQDPYGYIESQLFCGFTLDLSSLFSCGRIGSGSGELCPPGGDAPGTIVSVPDGAGGVIRVNGEVARLVRYLVVASVRDGNPVTMKHCDSLVTMDAPCDYRTDAQQQALRDAYCTGGRLCISARNRSRHQDGLALDIGCDPATIPNHRADPCPADGERLWAWMRSTGQYLTDQLGSPNPRRLYQAGELANDDPIHFSTDAS